MAKCITRFDTSSTNRISALQFATGFNSLSFARTPIFPKCGNSRHIHRVVDLLRAHAAVNDIKPEVVLQLFRVLHKFDSICHSSKILQPPKYSRQNPSTSKIFVHPNSSFLNTQSIHTISTKDVSASRASQRFGDEAEGAAGGDWLQINS